MWMISFLPDALLYFFIWLILVSGIGLVIASYFTRFIPPLIPYTKVARIVGALMFVGGVYFYGGYAVEMEWREKVAILEAKIQESEKKSSDANTMMKKEYGEKLAAAKAKEVIVYKQIEVAAQKIDAECKVAPEVIEILNFAAKRPEVKQ